MINNPQFRKKIKETVSVRMAAAVKPVRIPAWYAMAATCIFLCRRDSHRTG
jgi:hypothetical protein